MNYANNIQDFHNNCKISDKLLNTQNKNINDFEKKNINDQPNYTINIIDPNEMDLNFDKNTIKTKIDYVEENKINFENAKENIIFYKRKSSVSNDIPILKAKGVMNRNIDENKNIFNNHDHEIKDNEDERINYKFSQILNQEIPQQKNPNKENNNIENIININNIEDDFNNITLNKKNNKNFSDNKENQIVQENISTSDKDLKNNQEFITILDTKKELLEKEIEINEKIKLFKDKNLIYVFINKKSGSQEGQIFINIANKHNKNFPISIEETKILKDCYPNIYIVKINTNSYDKNKHDDVYTIIIDILDKTSKIDGIESLKEETLYSNK